MGFDSIQMGLKKFAYFILKQVLRVWRMRHGDKDEDEKNDDIDYRMLMVRALIFYIFIYLF